MMPTGFPYVLQCQHLNDGMMATVCEKDDDCAEACGAQSGCAVEALAGQRRFCRCR